MSTDREQLEEIQRRHQFIMSEPNGFVRDTMIADLLNNLPEPTSPSPVQGVEEAAVKSAEEFLKEKFIERVIVEENRTGDEALKIWESEVHKDVKDFYVSILCEYASQFQASRSKGVGMDFIMDYVNRKIKEYKLIHDSKGQTWEAKLDYRIRIQELEYLLKFIDESAPLSDNSQEEGRESEVICCRCNKPIDETGTALDGKPCHIACFHRAKLYESYPGESDNDAKDLIIHGLIEGAEQWEQEAVDWKRKYEEIICNCQRHMGSTKIHSQQYCNNCGKPMPVKYNTVETLSGSEGKEEIVRCPGCGVIEGSGECRCYEDTDN